MLFRSQVESGKLGIEANLTMSGQALKELGMDQTEMAVNLDMTYKDLKKESVGISADFGLSVTGMDLKGSLYVKDSDMYVFSVMGCFNDCVMGKSIFTCLCRMVPGGCGGCL